MNNKKIIFLLLLSSLAYSAEEMKKENKIEGEVNFGIDATFGVDGAETLVRMFPPMIDILRPYKFNDYESILKDEGSTNPGESPSLEEPKTFIPQYEGLNRDLELAVKYLSQNVELRKKMGIKLKEKYIGLGLSVDVLGKQITHTEFLGDNKIEKIKLSLTSDNKYVNGNVNVYIKGESKEKVDIDKIDGEEKLENKVVDYSVRINPIPDKKYSISLDFDGRNKNVYYGPTFRYKNSGFYLDASLIFNNVKEKYDVSRELDKIKYIAPGYDKIEYFKKWTQKEEYKNPKDVYTSSEYDLDKVNLKTAEVSGFKGTKRILNHYSGSLFGDSPFRFIPKIIFDEIHNNPNFRTMSSVIKVLEKNEVPGKISLLSAGVQNLGSEINNKAAINELANKVGKKIYDRLGISQDRRYSSIGIWSQIPKEFAYLLPGFLSDFDYSKIKIKELEPDYLYNNKLINSNLPDTYALIETGNYNINKKTHFFGNDIKKYVIDEIYKEYKINKILELGNTSTGGLVLDGILGSIFGGGRINEVISYLPLLQDVIKNPYEIKNVDMLRAFYFHQSEKEKNVSIYEKELKTEFEDVDLKENKAIHSTKLKFNVGHFDQYYNIGGSLILNDNIIVDAEKYGYRKNATHIGLSALYKKDLIDFNSKFIITSAKNKLFRKDNGIILKYNTIDLKTDTYFGLNIPASKNFNIGMGIRHIGEFGWINPKVIKDSNGNSIKWNNLAKRDENNNPIGLDGNSLIISNTTEKELVDKVAEVSTKLKRDIHQSDYIQKTESDPVKSMFELYNIVSPRITMRYIPYNNFIFTSHLEVPISIRKDAPAGIRGIYTGEIKYLLDDSFTDVIKMKNNPIKFKTDGYIQTGLKMGSNVGYYLNYKAIADATVLRADVNGNDKNIDFSLSFNPLVVNFPIKPRLIVAKEDEKLVTKYGLEYSKDTEFSSLIGFKNVIKSNKNIVKKELIPNILEILKSRNENEYEKMSKVLSDINFNEKMTYTSTPFIDIKKEEGDFKLNIKADSLKGTGEQTKSENKIEEKAPRELDLNGEKSDYFAWAFQSEGIFSSWYYYFTNVRYDKKEIKNEINKKLDYEKYSLLFDTSYTKKTGINFEAKLDINYNFIKFMGSEINKTIIETTEKTKGIFSKLTKPTFSKNDLLNSDNDVIYDENDVLNSFKKYIRKKGTNDKKERIFLGKKRNLATETDLEKLLVKNPEIHIENNIKENLLLETKKISGKFDTYLGYNFNPKEKMILSVGTRYNLDIDYLSINKILLNDISLFGSRKIVINNTLIPEFRLKYELFKKLNSDLKVSVPFRFENKDFKDIKFNISAGLEYSW